MEDFRERLYASYVSEFKRENATLSESELQHYFKYCEARYFPALAHLPLTATILEIGCGHGKFLSFLKHKGFTNATGVDLSREQVELARARGLNAKAVNIFELPSYFEKNTLDAVVAIDIFEHFTKQELFQVLDILSSLLTTKGVLLIQTVNGEGLYPHQIIHGDLTHATVLTPGSMQQLLQATGFRVESFHETIPLMPGLKGAVRSALWRIIRSLANLVRVVEKGKGQSVWSENFITVARKIQDEPSRSNKHPLANVDAPE